MFVSTHIDFLHFQKARILSERALKKKKFKRVNLSTDEEKKLQYYNNIDVSSLSESNLVEFQELYCKLKLYESINSGKFSASLKFTIDIHYAVVNWLKYYGYYLCPYKPINYNGSWLEQYINPPSESTTIFELRW